MITTPPESRVVRYDAVVRALAGTKPGEAYGPGSPSVYTSRLLTSRTSHAQRETRRVPIGANVSIGAAPGELDVRQQGATATWPTSLRRGWRPSRG